MIPILTDGALYTIRYKELHDVEGTYIVITVTAEDFTVQDDGLTRITKKTNKDNTENVLYVLSRNILTIEGVEEYIDEEDDEEDDIEEPQVSMGD